MSSVKRQGPSAYEFAASCSAAGIAGGITVALFNPLDTVKVRYQVTRMDTPISILQFGKDIIAVEGLVPGLWAPGVLANSIGIGMSSMGRVGLYPFIRDLAAPQSAGGASPQTMFASGLLAGAIGYFFSTPIYQIKTLKQAEAGILTEGGILKSGVKSGQEAVFHGRSLSSCLNTLASQKALFRGSLALVVRGALLSAGQSAGYDGFKTYARKRDSNNKESPLVHVGASVVGAFVGTVSATPADVIMTRLQTQSFPSISACLQHIIKTDGPLGLYRGFLPFFVRLAPVFIVSLPATEQLRRLLGLGYI